MDMSPKIPMATLIDMADILYRGAKKEFQDPAFQKAYEEWAEERRKRRQNENQ